MKRLIALVALALSCACFAQTPHPSINAPVFRAFDANGVPLAGGQLFSYQAGTSTPLATCADALCAANNANPVILDSTGQHQIFLNNANYKFVLQDANGVQQWSVDNINGSLSTAVTSFNTRTGAVVSQTGDYSCAQITGAICALPSVNYQLIQSNGISQTQRNALNLIPGSNFTVNCVDNSGNNSTDCTLNTVSGQARQCSGTTIPWSCYKVASDGTIEEWGVSNAVTPSGTAKSATVSITFPYAFSNTNNLAITTNPDNCPNGSCAGDYVLASHPIGSTVTTAGFTAYAGSGDPVGGGGATITGTIHVFWRAIGN